MLILFLYSTLFQKFKINIHPLVHYLHFELYNDNILISLIDKLTLKFICFNDRLVLTIFIHVSYQALILLTYPFIISYRIEFRLIYNDLNI